MKLIGAIPPLETPRPQMGTGTVTVTFHLGACDKTDMDYVARRLVDTLVQSMGDKYNATDLAVDGVGWYEGGRPSQG